MHHRRATGAEGETLAIDFLRRKGFSILHRNLRLHPYEIDIVARKGDVVHLVEVKTSRLPGWDPIIQMTPAKETALTEAADAFLRQYPETENIQIDLVAVILTGKQPVIRYYPDIIR